MPPGKARLRLLTLPPLRDESRHPGRRRPCPHPPRSVWTRAWTLFTPLSRRGSPNAYLGCAIGEATGLHLDDLDLDNGVIYMRRSVWSGQELEPKTDNSVREIDIGPALVAMLRQYIGPTRRTRLFEARNGSPLRAGNIRKRVLQLLLEKLGIPKAGMHASRHARVTLLRKNGTPADLQKQWIGHSSLTTTDRYAHRSGTGIPASCR